MIEGACHCGKLSWRFEGTPDGATACNCTICRRHSALWIYGYENNEITVSGSSRTYERGKKWLAFHFCSDCGCVAWWRSNSIGDDGRRRIAVNVRLAEPEAVADIPIDHFDGLKTFKDLARDGKRVVDYWF